MKGFKAACGVLPPGMAERAERLSEEDKTRAEEFRLRVGYPPTVLLDDGERAFSADLVTPEDIRLLAERASRSSLHAQQEALRQGFLSAGEGVRVGLCGERRGDSLGAFSSGAVRIPRAVPGCADPVWRELIRGGFSSTLLLAPPGGGKTTLLRELVCRLSRMGFRVGLVDQRGEIAGCADGVAGFDVGPFTDVITGVPKPRAVSMLLRAMNPQIIAMDEITDSADSRALLEAVGCGVALLATAHAGSREELSLRRTGMELLESGAFSRYVTVSRRGRERVYSVEDFSWTGWER